MKYINLNGKIFSESEKTISATSRAVSYGDGCFETIRSYSGKFLNFEEHFERLQAGLRYLEMKSELTEEKLRLEIQKLLEKNNLKNKDTVVRIQCFRKGKSGYFDLSEESVFVISTREVLVDTSDIKLKTVSVRAIPSISLERKVKLSNSINYIKAAQEAQKKGVDDALMLTVDGFISETTIANVFWIKEDKISTPSVSCDLLPGVTRNIIITMIKEDPALTFLESEFKPDDIYNADAVFCTNSVMEIKAVSMVDDHSFDTQHTILSKLKKEFSAYKAENLN
ncbi:MAG: aminotransferase class IV [Balneola sp.]